MRWTWPKAGHSGNDLRPNLVGSARSFRPCEDHDAYETNDPGHHDKDHDRCFYFHWSLLHSGAGRKGTGRRDVLGTPASLSSSTSAWTGAPVTRRAAHCRSRRRARVGSRLQTPSRSMSHSALWSPLVSQQLARCLKSREIGERATSQMRAPAWHLPEIGEINTTKLDARRWSTRQSGA